MQQTHGNFSPGGAKVIHGHIPDKTTRRIELVVSLAHRFDELKAARNKIGLMELSIEWDGLGGTNTAQRIRLLASEM